MVIQSDKKEIHWWQIQYSSKWHVLAIDLIILDKLYTVVMIVTARLTSVDSDLDRN